MRTTITFEIDTNDLVGTSDARLAALWHISQANPAPHTDRDAGRLAEGIGREIIRRWLREAPTELWAHQGETYYWDILVQHGSWPGPKSDTWMPNPSKPIDTAPADTEENPSSAPSAQENLP